MFWVPKSPYARKVIVVAHELGIAEKIDLQQITVTPPNAELMQYNPLNKVPTLVLDDGTALYDSPVICEYLDSLGPASLRLFPPADPGRWRALTRQALGDGLMDLLIDWRVESTLPAERQSAERIEKCRLKVDRVLDVIESQVENVERPDIGDIAVACALGYMQFRFPELLLARRRVARWYETIEQRPGLADTRISE